MKRVHSATSFIVTAFLSTANLVAQPTTTSYQGRLQTNGMDFSGTAQFQFAILCSGAIVWTNDDTSGNPPTGSISVGVDEGLFRVLLGDASLGMPALLPSLLSGCDSPALRVWVDTGSGFEQLSDQPFSSSPWALVSGGGSGDGGGWVDNGSTVALETDTDLVGVGTQVPTSKLTVAGPIRNSVAGSTTILVRGPEDSGTPSADGFRLRNQDDFFGVSQSALIFEITDGNTLNPDDGLLFANTGNDGIMEPAVAIDGAGNVGVGTIAPEERLHVEGTVYGNRTGIGIAAGVSGVGVSPDDFATGLVGTAQTNSSNDLHLAMGVLGAVIDVSPRDAYGGIFSAITAANATPFGIFASADMITGWAGYFDGDVFITGNEYDEGGGRSAVSLTGGERRLLHHQLTPEAWVEDFGEASLVAGSAAVAIEATFLDIIDPLSTYHVFLTPNGDCSGLYVASRGAGSFTVQELQGGVSNISFSYRIVAKRLGFATERFELLKDAPPGDVSSAVQSVLGSLPGKMDR